MGRATGVIVLGAGLFLLYGAVTGTAASMIGALFGARLRPGPASSSGSSSGGLAGANNPVKGAVDAINRGEKSILGSWDPAFPTPSFGGR